jgi:hypothetical protein
LTPTSATHAAIIQGGASPAIAAQNSAAPNSIDAVVRGQLA